MLFKYLFVFILHLLCRAAELPSFVQKCHYGDTQCISEVATELLRNYPTEMKKLGFSQIDPWRIEKVVVDESIGQPINLKMILSNLELRGLQAATFYKAVGWSQDPLHSKFEMYGTIPKLNFTGNYNVEGVVISLPIQGVGDYNMVMEDVSFQFKFKPAVNVRDGKQYLKIRKLKLLIDPAKLKIRLTNLFDGNEELGNSVNDVLNQNWRNAYDELAPAMYQINEEILIKNLQKLFDMFAYEELFLPNL